MALFTDADVVTLDDLLKFESSLVQISSTHGIDVATKINLAASGIGDRLMLWLLKESGSDPQSFKRRVLGLSTVVVTPTLHKWLCFDSLARFFAEAYNVQLNTRFQGKWTEYQQQASAAADIVFMSGLGIIYDPLPKPPLPLVSVQSGTTPAQALFVQTAWVNRNGIESALSPINGVILQSNSGVAVTMIPATAAPPSAATGWNIYAAATPNGVTRQNNSPLPINFAWQLPNSGPSAGPEPSNGQEPDLYVTLSRQIQRG
jgi:hypothetical protein